jgi:protein ImuB
MSPSQARALLPNLVVRSRDEECERAAQESLLEIAEDFSPRIENTGEGVAYLDLTGLEHHFSGDSPETSLAHSLLLAGEKAGLPFWVGIASSKLAARTAAKRLPTPRIIAPRQEARFLAPLSLDRLCTETSTYETLRRWGIQTIGEFAALPKNEVAARLGSAGQKLHEQARGLDSQPLVPYQPPLDFHEGLELDWPLVSLEPFLFVAGAALERLCRRLENRGLACARLTLSLQLEPQGFHERSLLLPAPTCDSKTLLTLSRLELEREPPGAPVVGFTFTAHPDRIREAQLTLFGPAALSPDKLATTLGRLFSLLGAESIGSPRPDDGHFPERFRLVDFTPPPPPETRPESGPGRGLLAVRVLRPPIRIEVALAPSTGKPPRPLQIFPSSDEEPTQGPSLQGEVRVASGPWTVEDEWWSEEPAEREYWDVELSDGGVYRIFFERRTREWFADGVYD